jgi:hypothetical protein
MNYLNSRGLTGINSKPMSNAAQIHTPRERTEILLGITSKIHSGPKVGSYGAGWIEWGGKQTRGQIAAARGLNIKKKGRRVQAPLFKNRAARRPEARHAAELVRV